MGGYSKLASFVRFDILIIEYMAAVLIILVLLWVFGYLHIPALPLHDVVLFRILGHAVTLWELVMFFVIAWAMETLPSPLRQMAYVLVLLWLLSTLGIIAIAGFNQLLVLALIIGLVVALFQRR